MGGGSDVSDLMRDAGYVRCASTLVNLIFADRDAARRLKA
jgi:hypothetical protein